MKAREFVVRVQEQSNGAVQISFEQDLVADDGSWFHRFTASLVDYCQSAQNFIEKLNLSEEDQNENQA
jgi:hypothetical protein